MSEGTSNRGYVGLTDAAAYLSVSTRSLRRLIDDGSLRAYKFRTRSVRVRLADLDALLTRVGGDA